MEEDRWSFELPVEAVDDSPCPAIHGLQKESQATRPGVAAGVVGTAVVKPPLAGAGFGSLVFANAYPSCIDWAYRLVYGVSTALALRLLDLDG
ncbi:MAG TPA: hypothetical protein VHS27_00915 [Gaiellales bacterium]|jgi:hypothetical protein|nr:hypothetical protein [Gaiellales bacterium]